MQLEGDKIDSPEISQKGRRRDMKALLRTVVGRIEKRGELGISEKQKQ